MTTAIGLKLSPQQQRLWPLAKNGEALRSQAVLRFAGTLSAGELRRALETAAQRHEVLRSRFAQRPGLRFPIQVVEERPEIDWRELETPSEGGLAELAAEERRRPWNLESDAPLRAAFVAGPGALVLTAPSLLADGRSLVALAAEISASMSGAGDGEEPVQYSEYAGWLEELLESEDAAEGVSFWRRQRLVEMPRLALPGLGSEPAPERFEPVVAELAVPEGVTERAGELGLSAESFLLAAWQTFVWRISGEGEVMVGWTADGRGDEELEGSLGPFARAVPLRAAFERKESFADAAKRVVRLAEAAAEWQEVYSPEAAGASLEAGSIDLDVGFDFTAWPERLGAAEPVAQYLSAERFAVRLSAWQRGGAELHLELHTDPARVEDGAAERLAAGFGVWLGALVADPDAALDDLEVLDAAERERLVNDFNAAPAPEMRAETAHELFARQAAATPTAVAVRCEGEELSYGELERRSAALAAELCRRGVGPEVRVAVCLDRTLELPVAVLGVLRAGGAFVPLDPSYPQERLSFLLDDSAPAVVLTSADLLDVLPEAGRPAHLLVEEVVAGESFEDVTVSSQNLAYVIYTSGSTGKPKGVGVPHAGLVNYLSWCLETYPLPAGGVAPVHSPIGFDLTLTALFVPLISGGTAQLLPESQGIEALARALGEIEMPSLVKLTPSHLAILPGEAGEHAPAGVILGGEALRGEVALPWRRHWPKTRFFNEYGPTETVVGCALYELGDEIPDGPVPIGVPGAGARLYTLDHRLRPVSVGVAGELAIGGPGVSRGYLGRPARTAERFVPDPFGGESGARLYLTGDLARHRAAGGLDFLGRNDHQVKVRGYRIELGEIEAGLNRHPDVDEAVVVVRGQVGADERLVAYLVPEKGAQPGHAELHDHLAAELPDYMVPTAFVVMEFFPLTAHGKVDRSALPEPGSERPDLRQEYVEPRDDVERRLAEICAQVLGIEKVGVKDSFFALGGDSIRSVRVVALANQEGLDFTVPDLFEYQTVERLAEYVKGAGGDDEADLAALLDQLDDLSDEEAKRKLEESVS